jgi:hypothetical protein
VIATVSTASSPEAEWLGKFVSAFKRGSERECARGDVHAGQCISLSAVEAGAIRCVDLVTAILREASQGGVRIGLERTASA